MPVPAWPLSRMLAELAPIDSPVNRELVKVQFGGKTGWIGLSSLGGGGVWHWVGGEPLGFTSWASGQPSGGNHAVYVDATGKWVVGSATSWQQFVCKLPRCCAPTTYTFYNSNETLSPAPF
jgi:hypothetical protein